MNSSVAILRRRLERAAAGGNRIRYPEPLRREVVGFAREAIAAGSSQSRVAADLGIPQPTLSRWILESGPTPLRTVQVAGDPVAEPGGEGGLRLRTPRGYLVEGLDLESIAVLLRSLA